MLERGFLNFFTIIFGIFLPGSSMNGIQDQNFFLSFSANLIPYWLKIIPVIGFLIFWIFLLFFSEFSCSGRVWTDFQTKFFLFSFSSYLIPFWLKIMLKRGFLIFWIFLLFFSEFSCLGRVWMLGTRWFLMGIDGNYRGMDGDYREIDLIRGSHPP